MNILKKVGYSSVCLASSIGTSFAESTGTGGGISFGDKTYIQGGIRGDDKTVDQTAQDVLVNFLGFLGLLAVLYAIYGGFLILSAAGDDTKVKKGKTILFQALLGLLIIFLAYSVISWLITMVLGNKQGGGTTVVQ